MAEATNYTAYCGLYCFDCNRSKSEFFRLIADMEQWLTALKFDQYAAYKASTNPQFAEYPAFRRVLKSAKDLACVTCRDEANTSPCRIRKCLGQGHCRLLGLCKCLQLRAPSTAL